MPGTVVTLRPDETYNGGAWTVTGGPTTVHAATADDSNSTYAVGPDGSTPAFVGLDNLLTMPPGARIVSVTVRIRWSGDNSALGAVATVDNLNGKYLWHTAFEKVPTAITDKIFAAMTVRPDGTPWTVDAVNHITVRLSGNTTALRFYGVWVDVLYNQRPTVSGITPSGTITTQQPTTSWLYADPDGDPQERWQVRVVAGATASGGFSPESAPAVADSGTSYLSAAGTTSWTVPQALSPGVYRVYVRAADAGSGGRWSDWASSTFTIVGDPPAPPALLSVTPNPTAGRVEILVRQSDNLLNLMTASADGVAGEYLRWYVYGNSTTPTTTTGGIDGNCVTASVVAGGEWAVLTVQRFRAVPGLVHIWAGWIKSDLASGVVQLDAAWFDANRSFLRVDEGGAIGLSTSYQPSEGRAVAPDTAHDVYLIWRSSGALTAGQDLFWDDCGIWPTRASEFTSDLEGRLIAAEDEIVALEIRVAELEGAPPTISIEPTQAPIDATAYRGGLDSSNLLGPADASFIYTLTGTNWTAVGTGTLATVADGEAYEGYALHYRPVTVGGAHTLKLNKTIPLPQLGASYQFSLRHRATSAGTSAAATLTADPYLIWDDGNGAQIGAPVAMGRQTLTNATAFSPQAAVSATPPAGATRFHLEITLAGETHVDDRWVFDQVQVVRLPLVPPDASFGHGPFGFGPFGGAMAGHEPVMAWKPASQVDVWPSVEYSLNGGATWSTVRLTERAAYDPVTRIARVYDYEAPLSRTGGPEVSILYRARTAARDYQTDPVSGALIVSAPTGTRDVSLVVYGYYIVDPYTQKRLPFLIAASGGPPELDMNIPRPQAELSPYGRTHKVILSDVVKGREFSWRIVLPTTADWDALEAMLATGHTLLVQTPTGRSWYVRPGPATKINSVLEGAVDHGAVIEFTGYEQKRPT